MVLKGEYKVDRTFPPPHGNRLIWLINYLAKLFMIASAGISSEKHSIFFVLLWLGMNFCGLCLLTNPTTRTISVLAVVYVSDSEIIVRSW